MTMLLRRAAGIAFGLAAVLALGFPVASQSEVASGQQCNGGPVPILTNTNCHGDSGAATGGDGHSSSSSSSSSGSSGSR